jgi:hypothetical protein
MDKGIEATEKIPIDPIHPWVDGFLAAGNTAPSCP